MKQALLVLLFLSLVLAVMAQTASISYGTKAGLNLGMHYGTMVEEDVYEVRPGIRPGFIGGAWLEMELLPYLGLNYELLYVMKGSRERIRILKLDGEVLERPARMDVDYNVDYLELPIYLKVKTWEKNGWSLSGLTGTAMSLKIRGDYALDGLVYMPNGDDWDEIPIQEKGKLDELNLFDFGLVYGASLNYSGKLDASLEFRFTLGWDYLELPTSEFTEPVELRNQSYSLLMGLRF